MIRAAILALVGLVTAFSWSAQPAAAREAPWCAVITTTEDTVYWDCQYNSIEQCRTVVLSGSRGWCNPSPYATPTTQEKPSAKRRVRPY